MDISGKIWRCFNLVDWKFGRFKFGGGIKLESWGLYSGIISEKIDFQICLFCFLHDCRYSEHFIMISGHFGDCQIIYLSTF